MNNTTTSTLRDVPPTPHTPWSSLIGAIGAIAALACGVCAQDLTHKAPPQKGAICITNTTIHPISGPAIEGGFIVFADGRITDVGRGSANAPAGATRIDGTGKHVYPGLIGSVTHLGLSELQAVRQSLDFNEAGDFTPEVVAATAVNPDSTLLPVTRSNGILTVCTMPSGGQVAGQASIIQLDGWTNDEMTIEARAGLCVSWPQSRAINAWWMRQSKEEQEREIKRARERLDEVFQTAKSYAAGRAADANAPRDLRWDVVAMTLPPATTDVTNSGATTQMPLFISANDYDQISAAVNFCVERKLKCVIVGGRDAAMCADLLKKHDIPVLLTNVFALPRREDVEYNENYATPAKLHAAGVRFAIATNDDTAHERNLPYHAAMAVAHGLPLDAAEKAVTLAPANILGVGDRLGSLDKGKLATIIVTNGSPLEVTTKIEMAFVSGKQIDLSNKQTKLYEKYRERYKQQGDIK
jgi:imidazolonepropionase-like amidohydrolase